MFARTHFDKRAISRSSKEICIKQRASMRRIERAAHSLISVGLFSMDRRLGAKTLNRTEEVPATFRRAEACRTYPQVLGGSKQRVAGTQQWTRISGVAWLTAA